MTRLRRASIHLITPLRAVAPRTVRAITPRTVRAITVCAVLALGATGCSIGEAAGDTSALDAALADGTAQPLATSVLGPTLAVGGGSANFTGNLEVIPAEGAVATTSVSVPVSGVYQLSSGDGRIVADLDALAASLAAAGQSDVAGLLGGEPVELLTIEGVTYARGGAVALLGPDAWIELAPDQTEQLLGAGGFGGTPLSPATLLTDLNGLDAVLSEIGPEDVGGVATRHIQAQVSSNGQVNPSPIDFWVGEDGLIHRMRADVAALDQPASGTGEQAVFDIVLSDHGVSPAFTVPTTIIPLGALTGSLGG